jgi:hypothetical protein
MPSSVALPHGSYSLIPAVLTACAWLASLYQDGCNYARWTTGSNATNTTFAMNPNVPYLEVGFGAYREPVFKNNEWQVAHSGACFAYPPALVHQDSYWQAAKTFDFLAMILGGGATIFLWLSTCCVFSKATWRVVGYEVVVAALFESLSFLWFRTSLCRTGKCELFWGSKFDIVSTVSAALIFCFYPTPEDRNSARDGDFADGTINTTTPDIQLTETYETVDENQAVSAAPDFATEATQMAKGQDSNETASARRKVDKDLTDVEIV